MAYIEKASTSTTIHYNVKQHQMHERTNCNK